MISITLVDETLNSRKAFLERKDLDNEMRKECDRVRKMRKAGYETVMGLKAKDKLGLNTSDKE